MINIRELIVTTFKKSENNVNHACGEKDGINI